MPVAPAPTVADDLAQRSVPGLAPGLTCRAQQTAGPGGLAVAEVTCDAGLHLAFLPVGPIHVSVTGRSLKESDAVRRRARDEDGSALIEFVGLAVAAPAPADLPFAVGVFSAAGRLRRHPGRPRSRSRVRHRPQHVSGAAHAAAYAARLALDQPRRVGRLTRALRPGRRRLRLGRRRRAQACGPAPASSSASVPKPPCRSAASITVNGQYAVSVDSYRAARG